MEEKNPFSLVQIDVLKEIGNIGAGNAATSMSRLINKKVDMQVPSVKIITFDEVMELVGGAETPVAAVMINIEGEAPGKVYFILTIEEAKSLITSITGQQDVDLLNNTEQDDLVVSAVKETGNILTGSYITALSDFTGLLLKPSVPYLSVDMAGAVLSAGLIDVSTVTDYAIIIDTQINEGETENGIKGNFLFLPDPDSCARLFHSLGIQNDG
ncbi:chemotaxis protein CheC [Virgibacillus kekensis]|uniref:Chemotaxis protein CheC n=1 Tax=Virgibacillus kekensis TaxID=202261 RepID=A0ABV9DFV5_9BACI